MSEELPAGWAWTTLGALGRYVNGRGFKKSEWSETGRPIIRIQNLTGFGTAFNCYAGELEERHIVHPGDLLISWAATLGAYIWQGPEGALNQHIFKVESDIDKAFHRHLIDYKLADLMQHTHGSGMVHITRGKFDNVQVALPPLAEQRRIIEVLEDHLSRLDAAAKLVEASRLRTRSLRARLLESSLAALGQVQHIPLADVLRQPLRNGHSARASANGSGVRTLTLTAVTNGEFSDANTKMTVADPAKIKDLWLEPGDILIQRSNTPDLVGTSAIYRGEAGWAIFPDLLIRIRVDQRVVPEYAALVLTSPAVRNYLRKSAKGLAGSMPKIDQRTIESITFPLVSTDDQVRIIEEVAARHDSVDRLAQALGASKKRAEHLRRALLAEAFSGKLVPQDAKDEPASELLARIEAKRANPMGTKVNPVRAVRTTGRTRPPTRTTTVPTGIQEELQL